MRKTNWNGYGEAVGDYITWFFFCLFISIRARACDLIMLHICWHYLSTHWVGVLLIARKISIRKEKHSTNNSIFRKNDIWPSSSIFFVEGKIYSNELWVSHLNESLKESLWDQWENNKESYSSIENFNNKFRKYANTEIEIAKWNWREGKCFMQGLLTYLYRPPFVKWNSLPHLSEWK